MSVLTPSDRMVLSTLANERALTVVSRIALRVAYCTLLWSQRRRTRIQLLALDPSLLKDVGLTPDDARLEGAKPFWRP